ncbi:transcription factor bHLH52 [Cucumis melo var. makuwa]|uniref:Transcription factor bHLH52 n=2 Tax=Cucumis melo TaxID=3656 RepID=A0A1S3BEE9_CUCME|nr:transcription factor bHLH52 [Cucumis melo]KAA0047065.1 transcription factor bHLH52 [Cucumis melo var. makuwa]TYK05092.1 transcription factor bHLH52 [Cucumis melo var. makuwa]
MAALTFHSNFYSPDPSSYFHYFSPEFSPDLSYVPPPHLLSDPAAFPYVDDSVFYPAADTLFSDDAFPFLFSDAYPYFSAPSVDEFLPVSSQFFPFDEFEFHCPKRQRAVFEQSFCCGEGVGDGNVGGGGEGAGAGAGFFPPPLAEFFSGPWDSRMDNAEMTNDCLKSQPSPAPPAPSSNNLSAQTIAARERRRKITVKTQELGELVPGGSKMNTAEMLNSAFKYVKFLQAQVAILQLKQETEQEQEQEQEGQETENLKILESTLIQEKLYLEEKCLVPKGFIQNLADFPEIQSHPSIFNSINKILHNNS